MPRTPVRDDAAPVAQDAAHVAQEASEAPDSLEPATEAVGQALAEAHEEAVLEALLDEIVQQQDPWTYLHMIEERGVPIEHRHRFYANFVALVSMRNRAEQDALISSGQRVFKYRTDTARHDVERLAASRASVLLLSPSVVADDFMAEIVYLRTSTPSVRYLVYRRETGETELADHVQVGEVMHRAPQSRLVDIGVILLPSGIEEYDDQMALFQEIRHFISKYLFIEEARFRNVIAYYVFLSWIFDKFDVVPYLRAQGDYGSGKTRLLQVVGAIANRGIMAGGATTAAPIFRIIERFKGTLVIDEADFSESDLWSEVVKILNIGYQRGFAVLRAERGGKSDAFDVQGYDCYGPKLLSTRKRFSDQALESRCLSYTMAGGAIPNTIPLFLGPEFREEAERLRNKLLLWRYRRYREAYVDPRTRLDGLDPRLNQILLPLLACADDERMRQAILRHAHGYQSTLREDRRESFEGVVAHALLQRWRVTRVPGQVLLKEVAEALRLEFEDKLKIEPRSLGPMMRHTFDLKTSNRGGVTWVLLSESQARLLARRYSIPEDTFMPTRAEHVERGQIKRERVQ